MNVTTLHPAAASHHAMATNRPWLLTASGGIYHFLDPDPADLHWADIIEPLARLPRFGAHSQGAPFSIAQHSCMVAEMVSPPERPWALLAEAHAALLGPVLPPVANAMTAATIRQARQRNLPPLPSINTQREGLMDLVTAAHVAICRFAGVEPPDRGIADRVAMADRYVTARAVHWLLPEGSGKDLWRRNDPELFSLPKGRAIRPWSWEAAAAMYADALARAIPAFDGRV